jgi:FixJ family two-component response regulator
MKPSCYGHLARRDHIHGVSVRTPGFRLQLRVEGLENGPIISVIDDDESIRRVLRSLMRSLGWTVYAFARAEDYLNSPHLNDTACLISDVQMPGMSGLELQSKLASRGYSTPIIFITAYPSDRIQTRLLKGGAVCVLDKPFDDQLLVRYISAALKGNTGLQNP